MGNAPDRSAFQPLARTPVPDAPGTPVTPGPWAVALAGLVSLAVAMGIGRFAFTPLLPMMLHDGSVTLDEGGWLATWNYIGYFAGAIACMFMRPDAARMVRIGLAATVALTLAMAVPGGLAPWLVWRTAAGVASALVLVYTTGWCLQRLSDLRRPTLGGVIFCGPGLGIAATGLSAFGMVGAGWLAGWAWLMFGVLAMVLVAGVWTIFGPDRARLPVGLADSRRGAGPVAPSGPALSDPEPRLDRQTLALTLAYGIAGFGYIVTATFLPVIARLAMPGSLWADLFWPLFGVATAIGALLAMRLDPRHDNRRVLFHAYLMQAAGVAAAALWPTLPGFLLSAALAGLPFTVLVLAAMREARRLWGGHASRLIGIMTAAYALGQIVGPPLATALVARTGGFAASLWCAAASLVCGALIYAALQRFAPAAPSGPVD